MEVMTLLRAAAQAGLSIRHEGPRLRVTGPRSAEPLIADLRQHKDAVLATLDLFEERAAILEFDAGLSREQAEAQARTLLPRMLATMTALVIRRVQGEES